MKRKEDDFNVNFLNELAEGFIKVGTSPQNSDALSKEKTRLENLVEAGSLSLRGIDLERVAAINVGVVYRSSHPRKAKTKGR